MAPKDKDHILKKSGVIYKYTCDKVECDEEYTRNQQGYLLKGSKNIKRLPPLYMIIPSDQAMKLTLTTSA